MLCGAGDTSLISDDFKKLVTAIGGDPWHYQSGTISYLNHPHLSCRSLVTQDFLDYCCGVGGYVGLGGDGLTGDLDSDLA